MPFLSNIGTPQGDSLIPVLFILYLEAALKEIRDLPEEKEPQLPTEIAYADDVDFVSTIRHKDIKMVQSVLKKLQPISKRRKDRVHKHQKRSKERRRKVKKVGSLLGDEEDMNRR